MGIKSYEAQQRQAIRDRICNGCPAIGESPVTAITRACIYYTEETAFVDGETVKSEYFDCTNPKLLDDGQQSVGRLITTEVDPLTMSLDK